MRGNPWNRVMIAGLAALIAVNSASPALGQSKAQDIQKVNAKIAAAQQYFAKAWSDIFRSKGKSFPVPRVVMYENSQKSGCGELKKDNAFFCPPDNAIYMDSAFVATLMNEAARTLRTDGDYAAIVAVAHELGHAVALQLNGADVGWKTDDLFAEHAADCYAGVVTRRAKTDKLLEDGDLEEGLFGLARVGDHEQWTYNAGGLGTIRSRDKPKPGAHGKASERQQAFLQGYYGGANFCLLNSFAVEMPPLAGRVIASKSLLPSAAVGAGEGRTCKWSSEAGGLRVQTMPAIGDQCTFNLLGSAAELPNHVRIELTVSPLPNVGTKVPGSSGLYYGDGRPEAGLKGYAFGTDEVIRPILAFVTNKSRSNFDSIFGGTHFGSRKETRYTLEIHHERAEVYFLAYLGGYFVGFKHLDSGVRSARVGVADQAGVWLGKGFDQALVKDFRVVALPD